MTGHASPAISAARLTRREFQEVFTQGKRLHHPQMTLYYLPRPGAGLKCGIAGSRKLGSAVARNRLRRRLRAVLREPEVSLPAGCDIVLLARVTEARYHDYVSAVKHLANLLTAVLSEVNAGKVS